MRPISINFRWWNDASCARAIWLQRAWHRGETLQDQSSGAAIARDRLLSKKAVHALESGLLLEPQSEICHSILGYFRYLFVSYWTLWNQSDVWQTFRLGVADQRWLSQARHASYWMYLYQSYRLSTGHGKRIQCHDWWYWWSSVGFLDFALLLGPWSGKAVALWAYADVPALSIQHGLEKSVGTLVKFRFRLVCLYFRALWL